MSSHQLISLVTSIIFITAIAMRVHRARTRGPARPAVTPLAFGYQAHGGSNRIDQTLHIINPNAVDVVPVLAFTPVSSDGSVLPGVRVGTAYGSDRGELVVCPGDGFDVLNFSGPGAEQVADVLVTVKKLAALPTASPNDYIDARPTRGGATVSRFTPFDAVVMHNPHPVPVKLRVVHLVYDSPPPGASQQVVHRTPIGGLVVVPPQGDLVVQVPASAAALIRERGAGRAVSVKTYPSR